MAKVGDFYEITLKQPHLEWGEYRYTDSRGIVYGEGYIPIPADIAYSFGLLNSNGTRGVDILGKNLFNCMSSDGYYNGVVRAQGNQADVNYAKQFSGDKDLKGIGDWFHHVGASVGDKVLVEWISDTDIVITKK